MNINDKMCSAERGTPPLLRVAGLTLNTARVQNTCVYRHMICTKFGPDILGKLRLGCCAHGFISDPSSDKSVA